MDPLKLEGENCKRNVIICTVGYELATGWGAVAGSLHRVGVLVIPFAATPGSTPGMLEPPFPAIS
jgi:hypothetical protein